ncbi:DUF6231 family protein [Arenicella chitinivorans]|nr:DUF6231 family protein [Arenicella chitinivorans]
MIYPRDVQFDIDTLINDAQPKTILALGDFDAALFDEYRAQKSLLQQPCEVEHVSVSDCMQVMRMATRFDVAVAFNLFEHISRQHGMQILARLRDVVAAQYCICLPLGKHDDQSHWQLTDLFSFALKRVSTYTTPEAEFSLFKYSIYDYKSTPDWLNPDNWANPHMWNKFRW